MSDSQQMIGLRRGLYVMELLCERGTVSFSDLQQHLDLPAPTLSRVLKALVDEAIIDKVSDKGPYRLGLRFKSMAEICLRPANLADAIQPFLKNLASITAETAACFAWKTDKVEMIAKAETEDSVHLIDPGQTNNKLCQNGFAQVCLAFQSEAIIAQTLAESPWKPLLQEEAFRQRLDDIRTNRLLIEVGEAKADRARIVSPLFFGEDGMFAGSLGIALFGNKPEQKLHHLATHVRQIALEASRALAGMEPTP